MSDGRLGEQSGVGGDPRRRDHLEDGRCPKPGGVAGSSPGTQRPGTALVERSEIDKVLGEQELQALLVADAPGKRAALGKMLKADLLIFLTDARNPSRT